MRRSFTVATRLFRSCLSALAREFSEPSAKPPAPMELAPTSPKAPMSLREGPEPEIFAAARRGDIERLRELSRRGGAAARNAMQATPLMLAAMGGHADCVELLAPLSFVCARDGCGLTALMYAAGAGSARCVEILAPRSDIEALSPSGKTARKLAQERGHDECAALLDPMAILNARLFAAV